MPVDHAAVTAVMMCGILVFDYAIGDPHMSWTDTHTASKPLGFKKPD